MKIRISEIFSSIEGEGVMAGSPTAFVRFAGCNLECAWCDTVYARSGDGKETEAEDILERLKKKGIKRVSITGGEPTFQMRGLLELAAKLQDNGFSLHLETNATNHASMLDVLFEGVTLSPKLTASGNNEAPRVSVIKSFLAGGRVIQLKFVLSGRKDWESLTGLLEQVDPQKTLPIIVQPVAGNNGKEYGLSGTKLFDEFMVYSSQAGIRGKFDLRFIGQWQKVWWGDQRGR